MEVLAKHSRQGTMILLRRTLLPMLVPPQFRVRPFDRPRREIATPDTRLFPHSGLPGIPRSSWVPDFGTNDDIFDLASVFLR